MSDPVLRHAGSTTTPGSSFGNQQYKATGTTRGCAFCRGFFSIGHGVRWSRLKKGPTHFWRYASCTDAGATKVLP